MLSQCVQFHGSNSVCIHRTNVHFQDGEVLRRQSNNFSIPQFSCGNLWQSAAAWLRAARWCALWQGRPGWSVELPGTAGWMLLFCCSLGLSAVETLSQQSAYTRGVRGGHKWNLCVFPAGWLLGSRPGRGLSMRCEVFSVITTAEHCPAPGHCSAPSLLFIREYGPSTTVESISHAASRSLHA